MNRLMDKLIVLILCMACYLQYAHLDYLVVPVICAVTASALNSCWENDIFILAVFLLYCAACFVYPLLLFFLPLLCYDILQIKWRAVGFAALPPLLAGFSSLSVLPCLFIALFMTLSCLLHWRTASLEKVHGDYIRLRDTTKEFSIQLENKNKELMDKQDYEVNLATLNERNRIARDIHDNIGHLLSNTILQTGALIAICRDDTLRERLVVLKDTLVQGMDSIRQSIHDLHDDSIDLYAEVRALTDGFRFCRIALDYEVESNPDRKVKYALLAIVKEALSNVIRHSDATCVSVALREHPALYQLVVKDNGSKKEINTEGIGLKNIEQRVSALKGIVTVSNENGFTVFASIPKEK